MARRPTRLARLARCNTIRACVPVHVGLRHSLTRFLRLSVGYEWSHRVIELESARKEIKHRMLAYTLQTASEI